MNSSLWTKIRIPFFVGLLILVLAAGFFLYERLRGGVELGVSLPAEEVELGKPFEAEFTLVNNSANSLRNVRVELELPENLLLADKPDEKIISRGIGDMVNGRMHRETFKLIATPGEHPNYKIKSVVYYVPASISANLQKREEIEVKVRQPDISLELTLPERIFSGEEIEAKAAYKNSLEPKNDNYSIELKINYPPDFEVTGRTPEPKGENNNWQLTDIDPHEGTVSVSGSIELPDDTNFSLQAELIMRILGKEYPIVSVTKNVTVNPSPLAFRVGLGNARETVEPGEELIYFLQYKNNANVSLEDVVISAQLKGEMFDMSTLETSGAADLLTNTLLWSPSQIKELEILDPGEEGQVSFSVKVRDYPIEKINSENLVLRVDARIESPTVPPPLTINKTVNLSKLETKVGGKLVVQASGYFRDAAAKIVNSGPMPPKVGVPTTFTIHWDLNSLGTNLSEVEVKANLERGVSFTGRVKSNIAAKPQLNPDTGEVIWKIGGLRDQAAQAVFQIEAIPNASMVGQYMPLLGPTEVRAKDSSTGEELRNAFASITTRLEKDQTVGPSDGLVRQ